MSTRESVRRENARTGPAARNGGAAAEGIARREMLQRVGAIPLAAGLALSPARVQAAQEHVHRQAE